ncbi:PAS domain S-box-containing protein [Pedobacter xixiisoli]|uniref:histidine kinase n=2 Tax=Pedobacter xixiisoli TaxID=1476464 RepID=A0A286A084_9SPHI|nr:PAS domain S-box-containing protein [Pedobacter xixiisoli]
MINCVFVRSFTLFSSAIMPFNLKIFRYLVTYLFLQRLEMKKFTITLVVVYLMVGALWLVSGSWLINELKTVKSVSGFQYLYDIKNLLFLIISIVSIVWIINGRYHRLLLKEQVLNAQLSNREQQLNEALHNYELVTKASNDLIWDYDIAKDELKWLHGYKELFGYEDDVVVQNTFWKMKRIHPDDRETIISLFEKLVKGENLTWNTEYRYLCENGSYKYVSDRGYVIRDEEHRALRLLGAMQDIDQAKTYSKLLEEQNQRLREIAWLNSHEIRRPLSNVVGLMPMFKLSLNDIESLTQLLSLLETSVSELDQTVHKVNEQTNTLGAVEG